MEKMAIGEKRETAAGTATGVAAPVASDKRKEVRGVLGGISVRNDVRAGKMMMVGQRMDGER